MPNKKNKVRENLREALASAVYWKTKYEELKDVFDSVVELKKENEQLVSSIRREGEYTLNNEACERILFLERMVRDLTLPADKLKIVYRMNEVISGSPVMDDPRRRNY